MNGFTISKSLGDIHESVRVPKRRGFWRTLTTFLGPSYLVSAGYMGTGNWATNIAGGSCFGYTLLWALLLGSLAALLLQSLSARLGLVRGMDLAQACRKKYPTFINIPLFVFAEIAIAATDFAEVIGMAIGLKLLFGFDLLTGVLISLADTFLLLFLINKKINKIEAFILSMITILCLSFFVELVILKPTTAAVAGVFATTTPCPGMLYMAMGIIGSAVMPHNLYLHSSLVQTRRFSKKNKGIKKAIKFNFIDSAIGIKLAFIVKAAILTLAATAFYNRGYNNVASIQHAYNLLQSQFSNTVPVLFAIALIIAGQCGTLSGTLAGQVVMEGHLDIQIQPRLRRLLTRVVAVIPAIITLIFFGEEKIMDLVLQSRVILCLQLGLVIIPLIHFVSDRHEMGRYVIPVWLRVISWMCAAGIILLNVKLLSDSLKGWIQNAGADAIIICIVAIPIIMAAALLMLYLIVSPIIKFEKKTVGSNEFWIWMH